MSKLQPIDTMPRDGTVVLVTDGERWSDANWPPDCVLGRWRIYERTGRWYGSALDLKPAHWMELPAVFNVGGSQ